MNPALAPMFTFIKLTSGRRLHALRQMRDIAAEMGETQLVAHIDQALTHERAVHAMNRRWQSRKRGLGYPMELQLLDQKLDTTLSALRDMLQAYIKGAEPHDDQRQRAERLVAELFPSGVYAITSLPYVEELAAVDALLDMLDSELQADASALHLDHLIARMHELADAYRTLLDQADALSFDQVKDMRDSGHGFMLEAVALVLGRYYKHDDADHQHKRGALLGPIMAQDQAMRAHLRARRRGVPDTEVDGTEPTTPGQDTGTPDADGTTDGPATEAGTSAEASPGAGPNAGSNAESSARRASADATPLIVPGFDDMDPDEILDMLEEEELGARGSSPG